MKTKFTNKINYTASAKKEQSQKIKTTDVNILLNRVRLDEKQKLKRQILLLTLLAIFFTTLIIYFID